MHFSTFHSLENNNIAVPIRKSGRWSEWLTAEEKGCMNASIIVLNMDNSIMYNEGNSCGIIDIPVIKCTF